ncbi:RagB/SusD family nutrient uptake outer membrane protein [Zunongwangia sp.]|uniref:RagB/SusD family nutrient uptake outer membrane protein n=1 Tax=Zunongwangia sp. TaxID=1965325 RepID=UPI003AA88E24
MKNYIKLFLGLSILFLASCTDDFLKVEPYTQRVQENFYKTPEDAHEGLIATYDVLQREGYGGFLMISEIASDNCFGGFGTADDQVALDWDRFKYGTDLEMNKEVWRVCYMGIYRANVLLENLDNVTWGDKESLRTQYEAEARFLRAYFHYELSRMFGKIIPLDHTVSTSEFESPRAPAEETYSLIANDLVFASENLGNDNYSIDDTSEFGRITKWAAESLLAKVFLFYTDYYESSDLAGIVTKQQATDYINDVVNNSGHGLLEDFSTLWLAASLKNYAGEANKEIIWSIRFNSSGKQDWGLNEGNRFQVNIATRGSNLGPYANGWGGATVNPELYNAYNNGDTRRDATIIDYEREGLDFDVQARGQRQYTGYAWKKYAPITNEAGDAVVTANGGNFQIDGYQDIIVLRFSDALLMAAELNMDSNQTFAQECLDRVRARAFQDDEHSVAINKENIMNERRLELALEGYRYFDLIRWDLQKAKAAIDNTGDDSGFNVNFRTETEGWFALPQSQIDISNGAIEQNPGW